MMLNTHQKQNLTLQLSDSSIMCFISISQGWLSPTNIQDLIGLLYHIWHTALYDFLYENCGTRTCSHAHYTDVKQNDVHT